jgi:flavodoxin
MNNILVAYFSHSGENYSVGKIEKGNTKIIAEIISEQTNGNLFEIRSTKDYPNNYNDCVEVAKQEKINNARPKLLNSVSDFDNYKIIFLGYPNWCGDMPMPVYSFLESYDFKNKIIMPFCTHEGGGLYSTDKNIKNICVDAKVSKGIAIYGHVAQESKDEANDIIANWIKESKVLFN